MSVLPILRWPDPRLAQPCAPVDLGDMARLSSLVGDMFETMYTAPGRGLAAPQVGQMLRLFVMDCGWKEGDMAPLACINPEILQAASTHVPGDEGCLSIPGVTAQVLRPEWVVLGWTGLDGARHSRRLQGFEARCAQHELDHLDGVLTFHRLEASASAALQAEYAGLVQ